MTADQMPLREMPVSDLMIYDVVTFTRDENVRDAMRVLVEEDVDAGPVVDEDGTVIGMFSTGDVIVEEARLHFPTIVNFLGVNVAIPWHDKELDESVYKALGEFVGDVMNAHPVTITPEATIEDAATLMHDHHVSRLPVVDRDGALVGLLARGDIVRAMVLGLDDDEDEGDDQDDDDRDADGNELAGDDDDDDTEDHDDVAGADAE
jgi:CBS domain-containing protein